MLFQPAVPIQSTTRIAYSDMLDMANTGQVRDAVITGHQLRGQTNDGRTFQTYLPDDPTLARDLAAKHVRIIVQPPEDDSNPLLRLVLAWIPTLLLTAIWLYWLRRIAKAITALNATLASCSVGKGLG